MLFTNIAYSASMTGTKKVVIVYPNISMATTQSRNESQNISRMVEAAVNVYKTHGIVYDLKQIPQDQTGWITKNRLSKTLISSDVGLVLMIGAAAGDDNATDYYDKSAPLFEFWDTDSSSVPILVYNSGTTDWSGKRNVSSQLSNVVDIGVNQNYSVTQADDLRLGSTEIARAKLWCGFTGSNIWNYIPWGDTPGYKGFVQLNVLKSSWAGNSTYGFESASPIIWKNLQGSSAQTDTVLAWSVDRGINGDIIFLSDQSHPAVQYSWYHLIVALSLKLCPTLYYKSLDMVMIVDDVGMPGDPGLMKINANRGPVRAADIDTMVIALKQYGVDKIVVAAAADFCQLQDQSFNPIYPAASHYTWNQYNNDARGQVSTLSKHKNIVKLSCIYHNHWNEIFKSAGIQSLIADDDFSALIDTWYPIYHATMDSLGWNWPEDFVSMAPFAGDFFSNAESPYDPSTEVNTFDEMLTKLSGTSIGARVVRAGVSFGPAKVGSASITGLSSTGVLVWPEYKLIIEPDMWYADDWLSAGDSMFVPSTVDSILVSQQIMFGIVGNNSRMNNSVSVVGAIYGYYGGIGTQYIDAVTTYPNRNSTGYFPWETSHLQTWHSYNFAPRGGQRKGVEAIKWFTDVIGYAEYLAGVSDIYVWSWGEGLENQRRHVRAPIAQTTR